MLMMFAEFDGSFLRFVLDEAVLEFFCGNFLQFLLQVAAVKVTLHHFLFTVLLA